MTINEHNLHTLIARPLLPAAPAELRRDGNVFFVGDALPIKETLETVFESHCLTPAELFHLNFGEPATFPHGEELARQLKKNFHVRLVGRFSYPATADIIERAYAAGVDMIDLPWAIFGEDRRLADLAAAQAVFPRWSVLSSLVAGAEPCTATAQTIDRLLANGIVPLLVVGTESACSPSQQLAGLFTQLAAGWGRHHVPLKPLLPLIELLTPLTPAKPAGLVRGFFNKLHDRQKLATTDLRRHLRVQNVAASYESAGL
jgi:hypothetical protein